MADIYVRSTTGNDANSGASWALAKATLAGADAIDAAGDTIYVSHVHAEETSATVTLAFAGTIANPTRIICVNDGASPPTTLATTGEIATNAGNQPINLIAGAGMAFYGMNFLPSKNAGIGVAINIATGVSPAASVSLEDCTLRLPDNSSTQIMLGSDGSSNQVRSRFDWKNVDVAIPAPGGRIRPNLEFNWRGGSILSGTASLTNLLIVGSQGRSLPVLIEGVDLSNLGPASNLVSTTSSGKIVFRNCKLPSSWTGNPINRSSAGVGLRVELFNCDSADTNYRIWVQDYPGQIMSETTVVRTGGASDGTTPISWRMVTNADVSSVENLNSPEAVIWNEVVGSPITVTVEIITDGVTLTDAECWLSMQFLGTSTSSQSTFTSDQSGWLSAPVNQTTSAVAWTTTGLASPVKQKLSVTFTPQEKGFLHAIVRLAKPSTTVYVCPKIEVT